jgi:putative membrane protein
MLARLLISTGVAGSLLSITMSPAPAPAAAQQAAVVSDSAFLQTAGSLGLLQVKLAKVAEQKSSSPSVKEFAKRITADYSKVNEELAAAAKQAAFPQPVLIRQHQADLDRFRSMGKGSFDKNYMAEVVKYHDEEARLFEQEAESGRIASLKQLATQMLPTIRQHLALANETARAVGADVTASTSKEGQGT